jgi:NEDD4-binding protein 2
VAYLFRLDYDKTKSKLSNIAPSKAAAANQPKAISKRTLSPRPQVVSGSRQDDVEEEVDYDYDELRAEAAVYAKLRSEAFQKAAAARNQKQWQLASYYAQQGQMHTEKMKDANRRAAEMTFKIKNKGRPSDTLDLHNLHVDEALQVLMETLHNYKGRTVMFDVIFPLMSPTQ